MDLLTILITGIGSGIAKGILNIWLEDNPFAKAIGKDFTTIFAAKIKDNILARRSGTRQFE